MVEVPEDGQGGEGAVELGRSEVPVAVGALEVESGETF
ncbi:hypothetical protein HD595_006018 [Nonomuraea roseoviolacea subsp. carminata]|uniref:Uncharacterized protein n=1 Tax=Nonomuraea roseoviolacea subsp. carminata TaxID=160689 RepID=A0ABT1K935_9ACTN|nr:hypothetical protein [Nonomuraea roseoviolacea subsp. carminata]